ncbi:MAG: EAL domain-containing protein [Pseudomonadota bacterium]
MWLRLSVRWQLLIILAAVLLCIEIGSLGFAYWFDIKARKALALEQTDTLGRALQHDLVLTLVNPQADTYSDISFRLSGFDSLAALSVLDLQGQEVFRHVRADTAIPADMLEKRSQPAYFSEKFLYLRQPLVINDFLYGNVAYLIDLASYRTRLREQLLFILAVFPIELGLGLLLAWWVSASYARPFTALATAMNATDATKNLFPRVYTDAKNEIGVVYSGYNKLIAQIRNVTGDLKFQSEHDSLTGLYNRYAIERAIGECLSDADKTNTHTLISLDIDAFKLINDTAGHVAGDEVLRQVSTIILDAAGDAAMVARVGGDDFFILCQATAEQRGLELCRDIMAGLAEFRFAWENDVYTVSAAAGVVGFRPFEFTLEALLTAVDVAFYTAKTNGHYQIHAYRPDDDRAQQYNTDLQASATIREALNTGPSRFELYAQSIVPLQNKTSLIGYEILLRLHNGKGEMLAPFAFLPTAERYQLTTDIDIYVLTHYLELMARHPRHVEKLDFVNINLAGATINNKRFQDALRSAVQRYDFPWNKLVLEVTETTAVGNLTKATDFIGYCRGLGIRVALDDFGTGMASFEYLKHLPLDIVKIDGVFIRDMLTNPIDHAMVSYAHKISRLRGQKTIAEFVETAAHLTSLTDIGIDYAQGYHLGRPRPLQEWLAETKE